MKLLSFEFKKIVKSRSVVILFAILVVANVILGAITKTESKPDNYQQVFQDYVEDLSYSAKVNYLLIDDKNSEEAKYQAAIINRYQDFSDTDVSGAVNGYSTALISSTPYLSVLIFCIYLSLLLAYEEHSSNLILLSYKSTRTKICIVKIVLTGLITICAAVVFVLSCLIVGMLSQGCSGAMLPLQSIPEYIGSPYHINVINALLARCLVTIIVSFIVGLATFIIATLFKRIINALIMCLMILGADYILTLVSNDLFDFYNLINLSEFLTDTWLRQYSGKSVLVYMSQIEIFIIVSVIALCILFGVSLISFRYISTVRNIKSRKHNWEREEHTKSFVFFEIKKLLPGKTIVLVGVLLVAHILFTHYSIYEEYKDWENVYRYNLYQMQDLSYEDQLAYSQQAKNKAYEAVINAQDIREQYFSGDATYDNYILAQQEAGAAEMQLSVFETIDEQLSTIETLREDGLDAKLVYSTGWKKLFNGNSDFVLFVALLFLLIPYFTIEDETNYSKMIISSMACDRPALNKFRRRKFIVSLIAAILIVVAFNAAQIVVIGIEYGLPSWWTYAAGAGISFNIVQLRLVDAVIMKMILSVIGACTVTFATQMINKYVNRSLLIIMTFAVWSVLGYLTSAVLEKFTTFNLLALFEYAFLYQHWFNVIVQVLLLLFVVVGLRCIVKRKNTGV